VVTGNDLQKYPEMFSFCTVGCFPVLQVLVTRRNVLWQPDSHGRVPVGAVAVGRTQTGETLYVGRVEFSQSRTPGKVSILTCLLHKTNVVRRSNASASSCMLCDFVTCKLSI
jgi:hypothetical protein